MRMHARARLTAIAALVCASTAGAAAFPAPSAAGAPGPSATFFDGSSLFDRGGATAGASRIPRARTSFVRAPYRWRGGRIPFFNAARGSRWAVRGAVRSWNRSGAGVRFVAVSRRRARLIIRYQPVARCVGVGFAIVGHEHGIVRDAEVLISRPDPRREECSRWALAMVAAHELGHVLGLEHETRRCAAMNPLFMHLAPAGCPATQAWEWRCGLLEPDDVRGAVRLYGGRVRPRPAPVCDTFPSPIPPVTVDARAEAALGEVTFALRRPVEHEPPLYVHSGRAAFAFAIGWGRCPGLAEARRVAWQAPVGGLQHASFSPVRPGRHCLATWALDAAGRASEPSTAWVDIAFGEGGLSVGGLVE